MLCEHRFDIRVGGQAPLPRRLEPAINPFKFLRCRMIDAAVQAGVDFERYLRKLLLCLNRPGLDPLQRLL
jgi:hypothetical protein